MKREDVVAGRMYTRVQRTNGGVFKVGSQCFVTEVDEYKIVIARPSLADLDRDVPEMYLNGYWFDIGDFAADFEPYEC